MRTHVRNSHTQTLPGGVAAAGRRHHWSFPSKRRRWESNPRNAVLQAAATPRDISVIKSVSLPGVEPGLRLSQSRVHPPHSRDRNQNALTQIAFRLPLGCRQSLFPAEESNLARLLRRQSCILHTRRAFSTTADPTRRSTNLVYLFQLH